MATNPLHMAALVGDVVTEGHAAICRERGYSWAVAYRPAD